MSATATLSDPLQLKRWPAWAHRITLAPLTNWQSHAAHRCLDSGVDFVLIGRGARLHHDFAQRALADPAFCSIARPVSRAHLQAEGLGPAFVNYVTSTWPRFVAAE